MWDLYFGNPSNIAFLIRKLESAAIENGLIVIIMNYGIIFTVPICVYIIQFQLKMLEHLHKFDMLFILLIFYVVGVSNPNLLNPEQYYIFIYSYFAFSYYPEKYTININ